MRDDLTTARSLAESVRFSGDNLRHNSFIDPARTRALADANYQTGLSISPKTIPLIASELTAVLQRLNIPPAVVEPFVFASADIAADCFSSGSAECVIRFSSQLIERFENDEFRFVAGHELGHFLLEHRAVGAEQGELSPEYFMQQRAQEISADRLGLIACGSVESAMRALIKTISGLAKHHLKFDVVAFISQLRRSSTTLQEEQWNTSHPSLTFRCRALLWFSMSEHFSSSNLVFPGGCLHELDGRITRDLEMFVDGPILRRIEMAKRDFAIWRAAAEIVNHGSFGKRDQEKFSEAFGEDILRQLKNFLSALAKDEIDEVVYDKMRAARENLEKMMPSGFTSELECIQQTIEARFR